MEIHILFASILFLSITVLVTSYREAKKERRALIEFKSSIFKTAKITDNIGNTYFKIVMEDCNGVYKEIEQYLEFQKENYKIISSALYSNYSKFGRSFTDNKEAEKELNAMLVQIGQLTISKKIEIQ